MSTKSSHCEGEYYVRSLLVVLVYMAVQFSEQCFFHASLIGD